MNPKHSRIHLAGVYTSAHHSFLTAAETQRSFAAPDEVIDYLLSKAEEMFGQLEALLTEDDFQNAVFKPIILGTMDPRLVAQLPEVGIPTTTISSDRFSYLPFRLRPEDLQLMISRGLDMNHADNVCSFLQAIATLSQTRPSEAEAFAAIMAEQAKRRKIVGAGGHNIWFDKYFMKFRLPLAAETLENQMRAFPDALSDSVASKPDLDHIIKIYLAFGHDTSFLEISADKNDYQVKHFLELARSNHGRAEIMDRVGATLADYLAKDPIMIW